MASNQTISHEIAGILRTEILQQQYRSGERLPSERDLAARFAASRGAVREALSQLEQLGLITIQPGGVRVKPVEDASIAILGPLLRLQQSPDPALVDQFLQTFGALSALSAREALGIADTDQVNRIQELLVNLRKQGSDGDGAQQQWVEFLQYLGEIADNLVVRLIGNDLKAQFVSNMVKERIHPVMKKKAVNEILQSLSEALKSRDKDQFSNAIQRYFDEFRVAVNQTLTRRMAG